MGTTACLKSAIFLSQGACTCYSYKRKAKKNSLTHSLVVQPFWKWTNFSWLVRSDARIMKAALRFDSPLPVCWQDPTTYFDILWARHGEDSYVLMLRYCVITNRYSKKKKLNSISAAQCYVRMSRVEFICGDRQVCNPQTSLMQVAGEKLKLILTQIWLQLSYNLWRRKLPMLS